MVTPLEKFKARYPTAALVSELVSTHEGQYVVRAAVVQKGEMLATGLAAHSDVQIAEDRARDRAIALLDIGLNTGSLSVPPSSQTVTEAATAPPEATEAATATAKTAKSKTTKNKTATGTTPSTATVPVAASNAEPAKQTESIESAEPDTSFQIEPDDVPSLPPEEDLGPPIDEIEEGSSTLGPAKPSVAAIAMENLSASASPVDLSDVIAQTDVELTRLGWTSTQGREYLEKTYGKRSRQQLTDEELMSFLLYLEDQPG